MKRSTKTALQYMTFVWLFTTALAFIVGCGKSEAPVSQVVNVVHPCGLFPDKEFRVIQYKSGDVVSHYKEGKKDRETRLQPGKYEVILNDTCEFEVNPDKTVTSKLHEAALI